MTPISDDEYRRSDLRLKRATLLCSICGFVALVATIWVNTNALRTSKDTRRNAVVGTIDNLVVGLDRFFIDHPELYPYFYEGKSPENPHDPRIQLAAELVVDVLDLAKSESARFPDAWTAPEAWDAWVVDEFKNSPVLCQFLRDHKRWYGHNLYGRMEEGERLRAKL